MVNKPEDKPKILIVDDDVELRTIIAELLSDAFDPMTASSAEEGLTLARATTPEAVVTDVHMPGMNGIEFLERIKRIYPDLPIIVLSGYPNKENLIQAVRHQAFDFLEKPVDMGNLGATVARAVASRRYHLRLSALRESLDMAKAEVEQHAHALRDHYAAADGNATSTPDLPPSFDKILTQNAVMRARLAYAAAIAGTSLPVLITGETGTGKDVLAQALHDASGRKGKFVAANIGGLDDALFADTLFGHVAGAFTNAAKNRAGLIDTAQGGTLFLDEIGDLSAPSQVKLLRLLESGEYYPLGADVVKRTDARVIAATHRDIAAMVAQGTFRSDLYFRLKAHHVLLPALRERKDDLALLLDHFLAAAAHQLAKSPATYPKELLVLLANYQFPGNLRELRGMVFDAMSRHKSGVLSMRPFQDMMQEDASTPITPVDSTRGPLDAITVMDPLPTLKEAEDALVNEALRRAQGNQAIAARLLGLSRQALNKRLVRAQDKDGKKAS